LIQTIHIKIYNNRLVRIQHVCPFKCCRSQLHLPITTVSAHIYVQEWICMEMYLQPIDRGWTLANNRLISLKIDLPLANCSCRQTCDTLN